MSVLQLSRQLTLRAMRHPQTSLLARPLTTSRPASSSSSSSKPVPKSRLLEKPTRFNPPSHPARLPRRNRQPAFSVPLSAKEKAQQKTKQYPHMMPPEGSFFHWFLTNRTIHVWITMVCFLPLYLYLSLTPWLTFWETVHPHLPRLFHLAEQFLDEYALSRSTTTQQYVFLSPHRIPVSLRRSLQSTLSIHFHANSRVP
jgi:hypothetical protein